MAEEMSNAGATPVVAKTNKSNCRFVWIAAGQGGYNVARVCANAIPNSTVLAINTSGQDLAQTGLPDDMWFKIGGEFSNGAGKNRERAKKYWKEFSAEIKGTDKTLNALETFCSYFEEILFTPNEYTFIIPVFSSDGGTGAGIGPMFTTMLTNYVLKKEKFIYDNVEYVIDDDRVKRPVVAGLVMKPSINAGESNLQNAIETFSEINAAIAKGIGHFFIADNNLDDSITYNTTEEMFRIINARIVAPLVKFFGMEMNSSVKCLDVQDKVTMLRTAGCSSFTSITDKNNYQFVTPEGQSVTNVLYMLKAPIEEGVEKAAKKFVANHDIIRTNETVVAFDVENSGIDGSVAKALFEESMIGFFGWKNLGTVVEDLYERKRRVHELNLKKEAAVSETANGFKSVKEDSTELKNRLNMSAVNDSDLDDLF